MMYALPDKKEEERILRCLTRKESSVRFTHVTQRRKDALKRGSEKDGKENLSY